MAVGSEDVGEEGNGLWAIGANMDEEEVDMEQSTVDGVDGNEYSLTFLVSEPMTTGEGGGTEIDSNFCFCTWSTADSVAPSRYARRRPALCVNMAWSSCSIEDAGSLSARLRRSSAVSAVMA